MNASTPTDKAKVSGHRLLVFVNERGRSTDVEWVSSPFAMLCPIANGHGLSLT
jgi:hypothetical protein